VTRLRHPRSRLGNVTLSGRKDAPRAVYARILATADTWRSASVIGLSPIGLRGMVNSKS